MDNKIKVETEYGVLEGTLEEVMTKIAEYSLTFGSCAVYGFPISEQDLELARRKFGPEGM